MTAIVMIFEMTRDYAVIVPVILAVAFSSGLRRALIRDTIYTIKLRHRGQAHSAGPARQSLSRAHGEKPDGAGLRARRTGSAPARRAQVRPLGRRTVERQGRAHLVVVRDGRIAGIVPVRSSLWRRALLDDTLTVGRLAEPDYVLARESDLLADVLARMKRKGKSAAIVVGGAGVPRKKDIKGVITKRSIADAVIASAD